MTSNRFFIKKEDIRSSRAFLSGREHHHLRNVARIQVGDKIGLFDERGTSYLAAVENIQPSGTRLLILKAKIAGAPRVRVELAQAVIQSKFMDLVVQKATEAGVSVFIPLLTERTELKEGRGTGHKRDRWGRIALEATKQCGRSLVPDIRPPLFLQAFLDGAGGALKIYLSEKSGPYLKEVIVSSGSSRPQPPPASVLLLVGPEGGFTDKEERDILGRDFVAVKLSRYTFRSETAAILGVAMINHFWNT